MDPGDQSSRRRKRVKRRTWRKEKEEGSADTV